MLRLATEKMCELANHDARTLLLILQGKVWST